MVSKQEKLCRYKRCRLRTSYWCNSRPQFPERVPWSCDRSERFCGSAVCGSAAPSIAGTMLVAGTISGGGRFVLLGHLQICEPGLVKHEESPANKEN